MKSLESYELHWSARTVSLGGGEIRVEGLHGVDKDSGDIAGAAPKHLERRGAMSLRVRAIVDVALATQAGLNTIPPAVIGTGKAHDQFLPSVEASHPNRSHHRLGSAHMKGHFIHLRDGS